MLEKSQPHPELFRQLAETINSYDPVKTSTRALPVGEIVSVVSKSSDGNSFAKHWHLNDSDAQELLAEAVETAGQGIISFLEFTNYPQGVIDRVCWVANAGEGILVTPALGIPLRGALNDAKVSGREVLTEYNLDVLARWVYEKGRGSGIDIDSDDLLYDPDNGLLIPIDFEPRYKRESLTTQLEKLQALPLNELMPPNLLPSTLWGMLEEAELDLDYIDYIAKRFGEDFLKQILGHSGAIKPEKVLLCSGTNQVIFEVMGVKVRISFNTKHIGSFNGGFGDNVWHEIDMRDPQEACRYIFFQATSAITNYAELLEIANLQGGI